MKKIYYNLTALIHLYECQKDINKKEIFKIVNLKNLFKGFSSEKATIYNLKDYKIQDYLSDFQRKKTFKINGKYSVILEDKIIFERMLEKEGLCPVTYGEVKDGLLFLKGKKSNIDDLIHFLQAKKELILKPLSGGGGKGIIKLQLKDSKILFNETEISEVELNNRISNLKKNIISECLKNGSYIKKVYDKTVNTVRVITMLDPVTDEPFIAMAVQRVGSSTTFPVDNVWNGGYTSKINLDTGELGKVAYHTNNNRTIEWGLKHKDTNISMEGIVIENWGWIKERIVKLAKELSFVKYVGWDLLINDDGIKIIEANNYTDVNFLQIHEPLLIKKEVKEFYKYHKII